MAYVGGLRARLIFDSLANMLETALDDLGWFDSGRQHRPINFRTVEYDPDQEIPLNSLIICDLGTSNSYEEMGSLLSEHVWGFFVDFYGEDKAISMHMIRDVQAILEGRMPSIGRYNNTFKVYDYTQATPSEIFTCEIENVDVDRAHDFPKPWQKFWYSCAFSVLDYHSDEFG
jgi:hypothetical protein